MFDCSNVIRIIIQKSLLIILIIAMSSSWDQEEEQATAKLQEVFSKDKRFTYRGFISSGSHGNTHRIRFIDPTTGNTSEFLIKVSFNDIEAQQQLIYEKETLARLRGGLHVVRAVNLDTIPQEPLGQYNFPYEWVALEWLPNGTVDTFIKKANLHGVRRLPNRLLWKLLLCLIRACCALAWPRGRRNDVLETELPINGVPAGPLSHEDMHLNNAIFGDFDIGNEHGISPVLKLIDFGLTMEEDEIEDARLEERKGSQPPNQTQDSSQNPHDPNHTPVQYRGIIKNLRGVAEIMFHLVSVDPLLEPIEYHKVTASSDSLSSEEFKPRVVSFQCLGKTINTMAIRLFPKAPGMPLPYPELDQSMREILAMCLASSDNLWNVPTLQDLSQWVQTAAFERKADFYKDPNEDDDSIRALCMKILHDAPP
ncbi:hypothetical protein F5B19DRAFT_460433 [Rostrohypoxylon terebratum]|nr:hypothetical protein F5B19DRAFT_460433 [Rostrohypoxylon terebratum]